MADDNAACRSRQLPIGGPLPLSTPQALHTGCVLIAEDNEDDRFFLEQAFKSAGFATKLFFAKDGKEACDYLELHKDDRDHNLMPGLLILDIKMPRMDGHEVLAWLRRFPELNYIPVVVMTGSELKEDRELAEKLGAKDFHIKPENNAALRELVKAVHARWLAQTK